MELLAPIRLDAFSDAWMAQLIQGMTQATVTFVLVATRLTGMFLIGPVFGHPDIPLQTRVLLIAAVSFLVTPALLSLDSSDTFVRLDRDHDGRLFLDEAPPSVHPAMQKSLYEAGKRDDEWLSQTEFQLPAPAPRSPLDLASLALVELAVGLALGLGVLTILSGLQMAGNQIDQQIGVSLGEIFNPEFEVNASLSGQLLHQLGLMVFLVAGGHFLLVTAVIDTFQALPVGYAHVSAPAFDLLRDLVQQSLVLAIQVAASVMATMAVVGVAMGFLSHSIPQLNVLVIGFPVRTLVGLVLVGLSLAGAADIMGRALPDSILTLRRVLMGITGDFEG